MQVVELASLFNDEIASLFDVLSKVFLILFTKIPPFCLKYHFFILVSSKKTKHKSKLLNCKKYYKIRKYKKFCVSYQNVVNSHFALCILRLKNVSINKRGVHMTYNKEDVAERIQRKRHSLNITQEQLAEMINTSKNTISNVERGENPPSVEFIVNICNVLGADPNYYILGEIPNEDIDKYNNSLLELSTHERKFVQGLLNYIIESKNK